MPRKPETKPLFSLKADFINSLNLFCQEALALHQAVGIALEHGAISSKIADILKERHAALGRAMSQDID